MGRTRILVVVSPRRMALYDRAFGLTMTRLAVIAAVTWIGVVLVLIAVRNLGVMRHRNWLPGATAVAGLAILLVANVADSEAFVVQHNLGRGSRRAEVDVAYLAILSDDAAPAIARGMQLFDDPELRDRLLRALHSGIDRPGVAGFNLAAVAAATTRATSCPPRRQAE